MIFNLCLINRAYIHYYRMSIFSHYVSPYQDSDTTFGRRLKENLDFYINSNEFDLVVKP